MRDASGVVMVSVAVAGTVNIPHASGRTYLALVCTADTVVTIDAGAPFTVIADNVWSPRPAPINAIEFTGTATLITG